MKDHYVGYFVVFVFCNYILHMFLADMLWWSWAWWACVAWNMNVRWGNIKRKRTTSDHTDMTFYSSQILPPKYLIFIVLTYTYLWCSTFNYSVANCRLFLFPIQDSYQLEGMQSSNHPLTPSSLSHSTCSSMAPYLLLFLQPPNLACSLSSL